MGDHTLGEHATDSDRRALKVVSETRQTSSGTITRQFSSATNCRSSTMTVGRELRGRGFHGRAATHKPNISPVNTKRRLKWCKEQRHLTVDYWKRVTLGEESRYTMWRSDGRVWVWRMPDQRYLPACVVPTVKSGGGGITMWGYSSWTLTSRNTAWQSEHRRMQGPFDPLQTAYGRRPGF
jgi:hypothetical protein